MSAHAHAQTDPRLIVGAYDPAGRSAESQRASLVAAAGGGLEIACTGPLTVAARGAAVAGLGSERGPLCILAGAVYNLPAIAEDAGIVSGDDPATTVAFAWRRLGDGVVERLRGDFSLVLWDPDAERGLLARDHMGSRGMYWHAANGHLLFGTELHHVLALIPRTPEPDHAALAHWIAVRPMPADHTLYAGVHRLPAGHLLRLDRGQWDVRRYWSPRYRRPLRAPRAELVGRLRELLEQAVARRCSPDGTTGLQLSGGLDSSTIAALAGRLPEAQRPTRAYSATFPRHDTIDESDLIGRLCETIRLPSTRVVVNRGSVLAGTLSYLERWRLPPVSPNLAFWNPMLARASADGVRVILDGEGGDEIFGLSPMLLADLLRRGRLLKARELIHRLPGSPTRQSIWRITRQFGIAGGLPPSVERAVRHVRGASRDIPEWARPATARAFLEADDPAAWKAARGPRWWAFLLSTTVAGMGGTLVYDHVRRRAAEHGIEPRHPLGDVDVLEFVLRLPPELAWDRRFNRPLLREAMAGLTPDEIRLRPEKSNFDALFHESLAGPELRTIRETLGAADAEIGAFVDLDVVRHRLLDPTPPTDRVQRMYWALSVWRLMTAECWLRSQSDPGFAARLRERAAVAPPDCHVVEIPLAA